jgi:hypothetical protein
MRPALHFIFRKLGIKGSKFSLFRSEPSTGVSKTGRSNHRNGSDTIDTTTSTRQAHARKGSQGAFYRLPDRSSEPEDVQIPVDAKLRPERGYVDIVTSVLGTKGEGSSLSGDEIPLHSIRVNKHLTEVTH